MPTTQVPVISWFTFPAREPHLIGSRCNCCQHYFFPKVQKCRNPQCRSEDVAEVLLSREGKLWSHIRQQVPPPPPFPARDNFVPYDIAEVKLPEGIRVLGQVAADTPTEALRIGMTMELVLEKFYVNEAGEEVITYRFRPAQD